MPRAYIRMMCELEDFLNKTLAGAGCGCVGVCGVWVGWVWWVGGWVWCGWVVWVGGVGVGGGWGVGGRGLSLTAYRANRNLRWFPNVRAGSKGQ